MHHQIDSLAYTNQLRRLPPEQKMGFAIALFLLGYLSPPILQLGIALWLALWIVGYAKIPLKIYLQLLLIPVGFWAMSVPAFLLGIVQMSRLAEIQQDISWGFSLGPFYLYLSQQGLQQVQEIFTRAIALTSCLYFILLTIPFVEIVRMLQQIGCPPLLTELLTLMYRFIFILADTATELIIAQNARLGYRSFKTALRSLGLVVSQLLHRTLDHYRAYTLGLASRGFNGELRVLYRRRYTPSRRYTLEACSGITLIVLFLCQGL